MDRLIIGLVACLTLAMSAPAMGQDGIRTERVSFSPGTSGATVSGTITGREGVDYLLNARAGQRMSVDMTTDNTQAYFNVLEPGETAEAIFVGSTEGKAFAGTLAESGDYRIRVYLMRAAARRGESADYTLDIAITAGDDANAAGAAPFDATGTVPCAEGAGQPSRPCNFGVRREGGGTATVVITRSDGSTRTILFAEGEPVGTGDGAAVSAEREADLTFIRIGRERYEIPDAVTFGG